MKKFLSFLLVSSALSLPVHTAHAKSFQSVGDLPGGATVSRVWGVSGDGKTVLGNSESSVSALESFSWTATNGIMGLGILGSGSSNNYAYASTPDGSVVVGYSGWIVAQGYRWTPGTGLVGLGYLPGGSTSQARDVSADGTFIVGSANISSGYVHAAYWTLGTGWVDAGLLPGANPTNGNSNFTGVSADGTVASGSGANSTTFQEAFRWTQGTGMVGLGFLPGGNTSLGLGISADGTTIVGQSRVTGGDIQAFRWTQGTGMVGLGYLPGSTWSVANATNGDGSIVVGNSFDSGFVSHAFRWTQSTGMLDLSSYLTGEGLDTTGWVLNSATSISNDGNVIVGFGTFGGNTLGYVANLEADAVTSQLDLSQSLNTVAQASQAVAAQTMQYTPQGLFAAQNLDSISAPVQMNLALRNPQDVSPAAGGEDSLLSAFILGGYGIGSNNDSDNDQWNGTLGLSAKVSDSVNIGAGFITGKSRQQLDFDGKSDLDALGGIALLSFEPEDNGFRLYATAYATDLKLEIRRGYENGASLDSSLGKTDGTSYGTAVKLGWEQVIDYGFTAMPYVEGRYAKTKIDDFEEQGGAFAAAFSKQDSDYAASRLGVEFDYKAKENLDLTFRPAWGHRITGDNGSFTADVSGLTQSLSSEAGDRNWGELTLGAKYQAMNGVKFTTEITGRSGDTAEPAASVIVGSSIKF